MLKRDLPGTDFALSVVGLGAWAIGGAMWGPQDDADSLAAIRAAVDAGVNWIDTAPIYGEGHSEVMVGRALREIPAGQRPYVFTKFGQGETMVNRRRAAGRADVLRECEASLKRLGVERIDLYQLHWPVTDPIAETAAACDELLRAGKIAAVGVSNYSVEQLETWVATGFPLHCLQTPYSLLRPASGETVIPWCFDHGKGSLAYSPLFRGMLFGTWTAATTFPEGDTRREHKDYQGERFLRHLAAIDELRAIGDEADLTVPQLAIGALLATPGLTACIVGARNAKQGAALADLPAILSQKRLDAVQAVMDRLFADLG